MAPQVRSVLRRRALGVLHAAALAATAACGQHGGSTAESAQNEKPACDLLVVDEDAGAPLPDGSRAGALLLAHARPGGWEEPAIVATDPRWVEPADALQLPDGSWLVLESKWAPGTGDARGALFRLASLDAPPELWWTDSRTRQPVCIVRDAEGTLFVSDRDADPLGLRATDPGRRTGCVFGIEVGADGKPARTEVVAASPEFRTPGALLASGPLLLLMDADANPRGLRRPDGVLATPGVLFDLLRLPDTERLVRRTPHELMECDVTTSPVGLIEHHRGGNEPRPLPQPDPAHGPWTPSQLLAWQLAQQRLQSRVPEIYLVDANYGTEPAVLGDGAIFALEFLTVPEADIDAVTWKGHIVRATLVADTKLLGAHALVDPAYGCALPDGRLAIADANADPHHLGPDGTNKGVYGAAHGAVFAWDPDSPGKLELLFANAVCVTPVAVRVVPSR